MSTAYTNLYEISRQQQLIIKYMKYWCATETIPVPQKTVIEEMIRKGKKKSAVVHSLNGLLRLGYIRRAEGTSNKTSYVLLRTI